MNSGLYVALGFVALFYVGAPLMIYFTFTLRLRPLYVPIAVEHMPREVYDHFGQTAPALSTLGFELRTYAYIPDMVQNSQAFVALWINPTAGQMANTVVIFTQAPKVPVRVKAYVEFLTKPVTGVTVLTNNSTDLGAFRPVPESETLWGRGITDVAELHRLHLSREARLIPASTVRYVPGPSEDPIGVVADGNEVSLLRQAREGYLRRGNDAEMMRPTLRGAFAMTYKQLPPFMQFRRLTNNRRVGTERAAAVRPVAVNRSIRITDISPYLEELRQLRAL